MNITRKVIIAAPVHHILIDKLTINGYDVIYEPAISYDELKNKIAEAEGVVVTTRIKIDRDMINEACKL